MELIAEIGLWILRIIAAAIFAVMIAAGAGILSAVYAANKESSYRKRAIKLFGRNGEAEEFIILSGTPDAVGEVYQLVVATSRRAEEISIERQMESRGIPINDTKAKQDTDGSGAA